MSNKAEIIKNKILSESISFITIKDVESNVNIEGDLIINIQTDNLETVELDKLNELAKKNSNESVDVKFVIPDINLLDGNPTKNTNTICVYVDFK